MRRRRRRRARMSHKEAPRHYKDGLVKNIPLDPDCYCILKVACGIEPSSTLRHTNKKEYAEAGMSHSSCSGVV
eukprot:11907334-Karenia_brevis.AAC.1